jgi:hypothetical protein
MTFQDLLNTPVFFDTFLKNDTFFNSLKDKYPEILADLTSSRTNPNCSCKNRVRSHLLSKLIVDQNYFNDLLNNPEIKKILEEKNNEIKNTQFKDPMEEHMRIMRESMFRNSGGKVFEIGKTEEDWKNLCKRLEMEKISFKSFSVIEKETKLVVYFV